jgi:hypothetical protein
LFVQAPAHETLDGPLSDLPVVDENLVGSQ